MAASKAFFCHPLTWFSVVFLLLLNSRYPQIGHDYRLFFPFLLEGKWHFFHHGIWPLRFAVHLCGGFPLYGNPNDAFYSITQLFVLIFSPWVAVQLTAVSMLFAGYVGWALFGRDVLMLNKGWRCVFAFVVTANGFYFSHVFVGHINFLSFPLIGALLWVIYDGRNQYGLNIFHRTAVFSLLSAITVYSGGYYTMIYFGFIAIIVAIASLFVIGSGHSLSFKQFILRCVTCGLGAFYISLSKITAVSEMLQGMPYDVSVLQMPEDKSPFWYAAKAFWALPQSDVNFGGIPWALHEKSMFMSPIVFIGLLAGVAFLIMRSRSKLLFIQRFSLFAFSILLLVVFTQLSQARSLFAEGLFSLPVFSSFRVSTRFLFVLSLWLSMVGISSLAQLSRLLPQWIEPLFVRVSLLVTFFGFAAAYGPVVSQFDLSMNNEAITSELIVSLEQGWNKPVTEVTDGSYSFDGTTNLTCHFESVFLGAQNPQKNWLRVGAVGQVTNGYFNLANPSCYQYGTENNCRPGEAIRETDKENFENFRNGKLTSWKLSLWQRLADVFSIAALILSLCVLSSSAFARVKYSD